ncbi:MAG TPA: spermidine/putrescine ABC transporter substrate-binding protein, partial [Candidatus Babeliales bacterium]|nr:spermidine/putrescine ABC transporter substrate-binding protein [Candidatus Babeliales bacterium]
MIALSKTKMWFIRSIMVCSWILLTFIFLYSPFVSRFIYQPKSLTLFIWPMILDARVLADFEKETGIKVYINYYESNEELYSKLKATGGKGYDIIVPTDYMVEQLINDGFIKKIDRSKLDFFPTVRPFLLGNYFDPHNEYSIPYYLTIFGLGINKTYFGGNIPTHLSWRLVFDPQTQMNHICMIDSPREAILLAALYLYGTIEHIADEDKLKAIEQLLSNQKCFVETFTSARIEELLVSGSCPIAIGGSTDIWKAMREYPNIDFFIPDEGTFATIDSFVISKTTNKDDLIYQLINFLYRPSIVEHNSNKYGFCPPTTNVAINDSHIVCPTDEQFKRFSFF